MGYPIWAVCLYPRGLEGVPKWPPGVWRGPYWDLVLQAI